MGEGNSRRRDPGSPPEQRNSRRGCAELLSSPGCFSSFLRRGTCDKHDSDPATARGPTGWQQFPERKFQDQQLPRSGCRAPRSPAALPHQNNRTALISTAEIWGRTPVHPQIPPLPWVVTAGISPSASPEVPRQGECSHVLGMTHPSPGAFSCCRSCPVHGWFLRCSVPPKVCPAAPRWMFHRWAAKPEAEKLLWTPGVCAAMLCQAGINILLQPFCTCAAVPAQSPSLLPSESCHLLLQHCCPSQPCTAQR